MSTLLWCEIALVLHNFQKMLAYKHMTLRCFINHGVYFDIRNTNRDTDTIKYSIDTDILIPIVIFKNNVIFFIQKKCNLI
jgi:hypothetical protein